MDESSFPQAWPEENPPNLSDLVERVGRQDREAFGSVYQETSSQVYGLAYRILHNGPQAEEICQEVYMHLWKDAGKYDSKRGKPLTWLLTICHRRCVERVRSEEARKRRELSHGQDAARLGSASTGPYRQAEAEALPECLDKLSPKQREVIGLVYYEGLTLAQAAQELEIPVPTAKTRVRDALKKLKTNLKGQTHAV